MTRIMEPGERNGVSARTNVQAPPPSKAAVWTGRVISGLIVALLLFSATMKFVQPKGTAEGFEHLGWPLKLALALGVLETTVSILYAIPQTAVLGAILVTGYLGGAIATHVRIGEGFIAQSVIGVLVWVALYLRDPRLRPLAPWRRL
jgi:hypothetical protein